MSRPVPHNPKNPYKPTAAALAAAAVIATGLHIKWEKMEFLPYDDARPHYKLKPGDKIIGTLTVCVGHTDAAGGPPIIIGKIYTKGECEAYLARDRKTVVETVVKYTPELYMNPPTAAAAEDFVLNVGPTNYATSSIVKDFRAGRIESGCARLLDWKYGRVGGLKKFMQGLLNRRADERRICLTELEPA